MNAKGTVEAALFSSSKALHIRDIVERTGLSEETIQNALDVLQMEYERRNSAIKISKIGTEYVMMLREEYSEFSEKFTEAELTRGMMKTLVTIAYNQPILQSELNKTIGARVYDDVPALVEKGLISKKRSGQTWQLSTTKKFLEYFGIEGSGKASIRQWIDELNGQ